MMKIALQNKVSVMSASSGWLMVNSTVLRVYFLFKIAHISRSFYLHSRYNGNGRNKFERLDHVLCTVLVFYEMRCLQMCLVRNCISINFQDRDVGGIIFFRNRI